MCKVCPPFLPYIPLDPSVPTYRITKKFRIIHYRCFLCSRTTKTLVVHPHFVVLPTHHLTNKPSNLRCVYKPGHSPLRHDHLMCVTCCRNCRHSESMVCYIDVVSRISEVRLMATWVVVTSKAYSGDGPFDTWIGHFECAATLNEQLWAQWLAVRLISQVHIALPSLPAETMGLYTALREALHYRFEPKSKRDLYATEFHVCQKQAGEDWALGKT